MGCLVVAVIQNDVIDCSAFLKSVFIYSFEEIESKPDMPTSNLHGGLYKMYSEIQGYDLHKITLIFDHLLGLELGYSALITTLKKPVIQPYFVFDFKVSDGFLFFAAYYSFGNQFQTICEKHGLQFSDSKKIWHARYSLNEGEEVAQVLRNLENFFNDIKQVSRVFFYKSTLQKFYRVA